MLQDHAADQELARIAVRLLLAVQTLAMLGLTMTDRTITLCVLSIIAGTFPPGIVPMVQMPPHQGTQGAVR